MGDICTAGSRKAGRNLVLAIWHSPRADASNPLSTCWLTDFLGGGIHASRHGNIMTGGLLLSERSERWGSALFHCLGTRKLRKEFFLSPETLKADSSFPGVSSASVSSEVAPVPAPASAPRVLPRVGFSYSPLSPGRPGQLGPGGRGSTLPSLAYGGGSAIPSPVPSGLLTSRVGLLTLPPLGLRPVPAPREPEGGRTVSGLGSGSGSARLRCRPRLLPGLRAALRAPPLPRPPGRRHRLPTRVKEERAAPSCGPRSPGTLRLERRAAALRLRDVAATARSLQPAAHSSEDQHRPHAPLAATWTLSAARRPPSVTTHCSLSGNTFIHTRHCQFQFDSNSGMLTFFHSVDSICRSMSPFFSKYL
ncbi:uncharacterized protein V5649_014867 [Rhynchonycteris naso]